MEDKPVKTEVFMLESEGLRLRVFLAVPAAGQGPFPLVQIHHPGGGYDPVYEHMSMQLSECGIAGAAMIHRGYPGSEGEMAYGGGEIVDIGNLADTLSRRPDIDPKRMGIMGYSRGGHNAILAIERYDYFKAGVLWSTPVDMLALYRVVPWISEMIGGSPEDVPEAYRIRSSIHFVAQVNCPLLILHGERDEVVDVTHALRLAKELDAHQKPYEMEIIPGEFHSWSMTGFTSNWRKTVAFFEKHLL